MASTAIYVSDLEALAVVMGGSSRSPKVSRVERLVFAPPGFDEEGNPLPAETVSDMRAVELRNWVKSKRLGGKGAAVLDASHVIFRDLRLEFTDRRQIDKVIRYQVEGVIPSMAVDELCVGYTLDETTESGSHVTVAAARRKNVHTLIDDLDFAGLKAFECDSTIGGILNLRSFNAKIASVESPTVWLDLQDDTALLAVLDGNSVLTKRSVQIPNKAVAELEEARGLHVPPPIPGVDDIDDDDAVQTTRDASGEEHIAPSSIDESHTAIADYPEEMASVSTLVNLLKIEIRRMVVGVRASAPVKDLVISGVPTSAQKSLKGMASELGYRLEFIDLLESMVASGRDGSPKIDLTESALVPATAGVALVGLGVSGTGINYLSGDLAPASTFDYVKWPIAVALMIVVLTLAFNLALAITEKNKLDETLALKAVEKNIDPASEWKQLQAVGGDLFTEEFPAAEGASNSAIISGVHRVLGTQLDKFRAGDKSNYPPVYESEKILAAIMEVFAKSVSRNHGDKKFWATSDGRNENFALSKFSITQRIGEEGTDGNISLEVYLDPKPYTVPARAGDPVFGDGRVSDEEIVRDGLANLRVDNPAWNGSDEATKTVQLASSAISFAYGNKFILRGERRTGPGEGQTEKVEALKHTVNFNLTKISKK